MKANKILLDRIKGNYKPVCRPVGIYLDGQLIARSFKSEFNNTQEPEAKQSKGWNNINDFLFHLPQ